MENKSKNNANRVSKFYDLHTDKFLAVYGHVFQAFRTKNIADYLNYTLLSVGFENGMKVLDAGCGVCGPAVYFAQSIPGLHIDACTISAIQVELAKRYLQQSHVSNQINVHLLDYHNLDQAFPQESFDIVYFLESFGHSTDKKRLVDSCWNILKPGGKLYIKDLFKRVSNDEWEQLKIDEICSEINAAYEYQIADLSEFLFMIRSRGFELKMIKVPEVDINNFERLTISNDFQNLFDIGKIESWDNYVFPIEFFELILIKPIVPTYESIHLYSLNKS